MLMTSCDLDTSVPDWIIEHPETLTLFEQLGIDYCCGGKSLGFACRERGLDAIMVLSKVRRRIESRHEGLASPNAPMLASIQVGLPLHLGEKSAVDPMDRPWTTGFYKQSVFGPVRLGSMNLAGDGQADLVHHGGSDKAVLAYSADHYAYWRQALNDPKLPPGGFGENFTVTGLTEADVCIGDIWKIGDEVTLQISQPRQPCWKLARRWKIKTLALQVQQTGKTGWYFRVATEGIVAAGMPLTLVERHQPQWTVERANRVMHLDKDDLRAAAELAAVPTLAESWQTTLTRRVERNINPDSHKRLFGENDS